MMANRTITAAALGGAVLLGATTASLAQQGDAGAFYAGKQVRIIVGVGVGSGYDTTARLVGRHIGKHIPGKPEIVVMNQPGAGSAIMSNALYNGGPFDGTAIGAPFNGMPTIPLLTPEQARFDSTKFNWIGSANRAVQAAYVWHTQKQLTTLKDILTNEFVAGSQAPGSAQNDYPVFANAIFGTKFKVINGYGATPKIHLAMESGEVMGVASTSWSTLKAISGDWIRDKKIRVIGQWGLKNHPDLADVSNFSELAKTDGDKQALRLLVARQEYGIPYFVPPNVPADRVTALRRAFDATMNDPAFLAEATRAKLEINPMKGEDVQALVKQLYETPPEVVAKVSKILAPPAKK